MNAKRISITAASIAIVTVLVAAVPIPIPATGGYTHPGAVAEIFVALAFGPAIGGIAAGVGAAIADLVLGYGSFAPLTLLAHGGLGVVAGLIGWKKDWYGMLAGWISGGLVLVVIYFIGEATVYGFGVAGAGVEVPINLLQASLGVLGIVLFQLVRAAYPQVDQLAEKTTFQEQ